jgi:hypothetical protein
MQIRTKRVIVDLDNRTEASSKIYLDYIHGNLGTTRYRKSFSAYGQCHLVRQVRKDH